MSYKKLGVITVLAGAVIFLASCTLSAAGSPTADSQVIFTQAAQTLAAQLTAAASGANATVTPLGPQSGTSVPVITMTPEGGNPVSQTTVEPGDACDQAKFIEDVTIPDGTVFEPGETFVKTWKIQNTGSCTWTSSYAVVFENGEAMSGPASFQLPGGNTAPDEIVEISVTLTAPTEGGTYRGNWKLRNPAGQIFGLGSQGTAPFWVEIVVDSPPQFDLDFDNVHTCDGTPHVIVRVSNNGEASFESAEITITDLENNQTIFGPFASDGPFMGGTGECPPGGENIAAGRRGYLGGSLAAGTDGHQARITVKICTADGMQGSCTQDSVEFKIP